MVAWAAILPALKAAAPWIAKIGGTALSFLGSKNLLGGSDEPEGSGVTYQHAGTGDSGMVPNNGNSLYSRIAGGNSGGMGIMPPEGGQSLFDRLRRQY
jgi:hypothetical protein